MKRIDVDLSRCEGHGKCYRIAAEMFEPIDDHGHAGWCGAGIDEGDRKAVALGEKAILECPEEALSWTDAGEE